jgi:signal transduction histidine kinase
MFKGLWPVLTVGFAFLLSLILMLGIFSIRRAGEIFAETLAIHHAFQHSEDLLYSLRSEMFLSSIYLRDYLLDPAASNASDYETQLRQSRQNMGMLLTDLDRSFPADTIPLRTLRSETGTYWDAIEPIFSWSPVDKRLEGTRFLREEVISRRSAVLKMAEQIQALNQRNFQRELDRIQARHAEYERYQKTILAGALGIGLLVAMSGIALITWFGRNARVQQHATEKAEQELRRLSQRLVKLQEEERRAISRELHDEVGQMLTGLRMEIGNLERLREAPPEEFHQYVQETRKLLEQALHTVRDLAMGLRPSMLDDLGLEPALKWQVRDFARRSGIAVNLRMPESTESLPESHSTCIYRIVQEALTNCAKHSCAKNIDIYLALQNEWLKLTVRDDGTGFKVEDKNGGLGLIGMEERVRELQGKMMIFSQPGSGTMLSVQIPASQVPYDSNPSGR